MMKLRGALDTILAKVIEEVHYQKAPSDGAFPYVVYQFPVPSFFIEDQEVFSLQVDVFDNMLDTARLEEKASNVWKYLNYYSYIDDDIQFTIYREARFPVLEQNSNIRSRELTFNLKFIDRKVNDW